MSCIQVITSQLPCAPSAFPKQVPQHYKADKYNPTYLGTKLPKILKLTCNASRHQHAATTICLFGGKGKPENGNQDSPWKAIEKAAGNFGKGKSIEDVLRQQIQKQEFFDDGNNGGKGPSDGGGGGGTGGDGFGEDDSGGLWQEFGQVTLATLGFVFLYIYIIEGEEINVIIKDTLKFLFTQQMSIRLNRLVTQCKRFLERMMEKEEYEDPYWLEREIFNTRTWFDGPEKYRYIIRALDQTDSVDEEADEAPFMSDFGPPTESDGASDDE